MSGTPINDTAGASVTTLSDTSRFNDESKTMGSGGGKVIVASANVISAKVGVGALTTVIQP